MKVTFGRVATEIVLSLVVCMVFVALSGLEIDSSIGSVSQIFVPQVLFRDGLSLKLALTARLFGFVGF